MKKQYLDYAGLKRVLKRLLPGARKIWHGTEAEWEALSETERNKYDQAEVIDTRRYYGPGPDWVNAVAVSPDDLYAGYTAPGDGMFVCTGFMPDLSVGIKVMTINNIPVARGQYTAPTTYVYGNVCCPVNKGDLIKTDNPSTYGLETRHFVPWK